MIITEKVKVKINCRNLNYFRIKGYVCKLKDVIEVYAKDLYKCSKIEVTVKCDVCGNERQLKYMLYVENFNNCNFYACSSVCAQEKVKKTNLEKFGTEYYNQTDECKNKIKTTNLERYGFENVSQNEKIKRES